MTPFIVATCKSLKMAGKKSGVYRILLPSGVVQVFCEMDINGGGYTFLSKESLSKLSQSDIDVIFTNKSDVLLRLLKPDGSQPYTAIEQFIKTGGLSVKLNAFNGYQRPKNYNISDYLLLGLLPASHSRKKQAEGLKSNGKNITFANCDGRGKNVLAFYAAGNALDNEIKSCDVTRMDIDWRGTAKIPESSSKMPFDFYMLTEFLFGGCGCYTVSSSWSGRENPANATAIGMH